MKCPYCLGTSLTEGKFDLAQVVDLQPVLIRNVPGSKCDQCGHVRVTPRTMKAIEGMLKDKASDTTVPTAVYDLESPVRHPHVGCTPTPERVHVFGSGVPI